MSEKFKVTYREPVSHVADRHGFVFYPGKFCRGRKERVVDTVNASEVDDLKFELLQKKCTSIRVEKI